jgi:hypothetical protein
MPSVDDTTSGYVAPATLGVSSRSTPSASVPCLVHRSGKHTIGSDVDVAIEFTVLEAVFYHDDP